MIKVMTPSDAKSITKGQIGKWYDVLADALTKSGLPSGPTQQVLATQGADLANKFVASLRGAVEAVSNMIVRTVTVDRTRSPQAVLDATGRRQYTDRTVVDAMPKGEGATAEVFFFRPGRYVSDADLDKEFDLRGLKPVDPYALAAVNEADPAFANEHPNATHWKDDKGQWCYATFNRWDGGREVCVYRHDSDWHDSWWFVGVCK